MKNNLDELTEKEKKAIENGERQMPMLERWEEDDEPVGIAEE